MLTGTIKELQWTNPHIWIQVLVPAMTLAKQVEWSVEGGSPNNLSPQGLVAQLDESRRQGGHHDPPARRMAITAAA